MGGGLKEMAGFQLPLTSENISIKEVVARKPQLPAYLPRSHGSCSGELRPGLHQRKEKTHRTLRAEGTQP